MTGAIEGSGGRTAAGRAAAGIAIVVLGAAALFLVVPAQFYPWVKALHVIAVISWMAGMLYLPRLFVYHAEAERGSSQSETFKVMERRLLRAIVNPAMIATWILGLWLAWKGFQFTGGWLHLKIAAVIGFSAVHGYFARAVRMFAEDRNDRSARYWRMMNEVPTLLMIAIVILVIVKPF
jgi:protoporphyrinogen IX oxidase